MLYIPNFVFFLVKKKILNNVISVNQSVKYFERFRSDTNDSDT